MLPCFAMWRRRILHGVLLLGSAPALTVSCSGSSATDINFGTDAGAGFLPPDTGTSSDCALGVGGSSGGGGGTGTGGDTGMGGNTGAAGDTGTGGMTGPADDGGAD